MAKKTFFTTDNTKDNLDIDKFLADDSFGGDIDIGVEDPLSGKKGGSKFKKFMIGTIKGAGKAVVSPSLLAKSVESVIPKDYGSSLDQSKELASHMSNLYSDTVKELKPGFQQLSRQIDKLVPEESTRLKKYTKKIRELVGDTDISSGPTKEEMQEQNINTVMGQIFAAQADQQSQERARDKAESHIRSQIEFDRFNKTATFLNSINIGIHRLNAYNDRITQAYQKKSLELQFRSLFAQQDLLSLSRNFAEVVGKQNNKIISLLALTDREKAEASKGLRSKLVGKFANLTGGLYGQSRYLSGIKEKMSRAKEERLYSIKTALEGALFGLDSIGMANEMSGMMGDKASTLGEMIGSMGTEMAIPGIIGKYRDKIIKKGGKADNFLGSWAAKLRDMPALGRSLSGTKLLKANDEKFGSFGENVKEKIRNLLGDFFSPAKTDMTLSSNKLKLSEINMPATYSNLAQKSITTVIPGYLARIYREIQILRTGNTNQELTEYSFNRDRFLSTKRIAADIRSKINKTIGSSSFGNRVDYALEGITKDTKLSDVAKNRLRQRLMEVGLNPEMDLNSESVLSEEWLKSLKSPTLAKEIREHVKSKYDESNQFYGSNENALSQHLTDIRESVPDIRKGIEEFYNVGHGTALKKLGLLSSKDGVATIDKGRMNEYITKNSDGNTYNFSGLQNADKKKIQGWLAEGEFSQLVEKKVLYPEGTNKKGKPIYKVDIHRFIIYNRERDNSDILAKGSIAETRPNKILEGIKNSKVFSWMYKDKRDGEQKHVGPMAQDVKKNLGEKFAPDGKRLDLISLNGANMAAIGELAKEQDKIKSIVDVNGNPISTPKESIMRYRLYDLIKHIAVNTTLMLEKLDKGFIGLSIGNIDPELFKNLYMNGKDKAGELYNKGVVTGKEVFNYFKDKAKYGFNKAFSMAKKGASTAYNFTKDKAIPFLKEAGTNVASTSINLLNPLKDVYVKGHIEDGPKMYANLIRESFYIDSKSKKVIRTLGDITGEVVDKNGNIVLTTSEIAKGLVDVNGKPIQSLKSNLIDMAKKGLAEINKTITQRLPKGMDWAYNMAMLGKQKLANFMNKPKDIYVKGKDKPVLYASIMEAGGYIDSKTKKVINNLKDLMNAKGNIIDEDGNIVLSLKKMAEGIYDAKGEKIKLLGTAIKEKALQTAAIGIDIAKKAGKFIMGKASQFGKWLKNKTKSFSNKDFSLPNFAGMFEAISLRSTKLLEEIRDILDKRLPGGNIADIAPSGLVDINGNPLSTESSTGASGGKSLLDSLTPSNIKGAIGKGVGAVKGIGSKVGSIGFVKRGLGRAGSVASKAGSVLGKVGFLKKAGGFIGGKFGKLASLAGGLIGGSDDDKDKETKEHDSADSKAQEDANNEVKVDAANDSRFAKAKVGYRNVRNKIKAATLAHLDTLKKGTDMSAINLAEEKSRAQREANEANVAHASSAMKYRSSGNVVDKILDKVKQFKGILGKAFSMLGNIPGISKIGGLFKKIPFLGKLFGSGAEVGEAATGLTEAGGAAMAEAGGAAAVEAGAAAGGVGLLGTVASGAAAVGGAALSVVGTVGAGVLGAIGTVLGASAGVLLAPLAIAAVGYAAYKGYKYLTRNNVGDITKFRYLQYGLDDTLKEKYHEILALEKLMLGKSLAYENGIAKVNERALDVKKIFDIFSVDIKNSNARSNLLFWFTKRFKPIFLTHVTSLYKVNPKLRLDKVDSSLVGKDLLRYLNLARFTDGPYNYNTSPFPDVPKLTATVAQINSKYNEIHNRVVEAEEAKQQSASKKVPYKKPVPPKAPAKGVKPPITGAKANAKDIAASAQQSKDASKTKDMYGGEPGTIPNTKDTLASYSNSVVFKNHRTGSVVMKAGEKELKPMISNIFSSQGLDPNLGLTFAAIESGFRPNARAGTSSAAGLFQFTEGTWNDIVSEHGAQYGITHETPRTDPKASTTMAAAYLKGNLNYIKHVKPNPNVTDAYLTHFLGPGGARELLEANPNVPAAGVLPDAARANASLFFKNGEALTVGQFYTNLSKHLAHVAGEYGVNIPTSSVLGTKKSAANNLPKQPPNVQVVDTRDKSKANKPAAPSPAQRSPVVPVAAYTPVKSSAPVARMPMPVEQGQGFHMEKIHDGLSGMTEILDNSLTVQKQMLDGIYKIVDAVNKSGTVKQVANTREAVTKSSPAPKPAIGLDRKSA